MYELNGKSVLVVGGSSGIGLATAKAAAAEGANVTIVSRSADKLAAAKAANPNLSTAVLDSTDEAAMEVFFGDGRTWDHIFVTSIAPKSGGARTLPTADAMLAMNGKFWSGYRVARYAKIAAEGSLTLTSGVRSQRPNAAGMTQTPINAAVEGLGRGLSVELAPVRVNVVSPGIIETPLFSAMPDEAREAMFAKMREGLPVRRLGQPEDVAGAVILLMKNPYITGAVVTVDGGALMSMAV